MTARTPRGSNGKQLTDESLLISMGAYPSLSKVNKFGRALDCDSGIDVDIHDGANASSFPTAALDERDIWTAPTAARVHSLQSTNAGDTQTVRVWGLTSWSSVETYEDVVLTGTDAVNTTNSYVIIHRMVLQTATINAGTIYATAATDNTITAQINPGEGQTQMAVYGIPSGITAYMCKYYLSAVKGGSAVAARTTLLLNPFPDSDETVFITKHTLGLSTDGTSLVAHEFRPYFAVAGPAIIKLQVNTSANNADISGGFDLILVNEEEQRKGSD